MRKVSGSLEAYREAAVPTLLADHTPGHTETTAVPVCSASQNDYVYEGIYVLEHDKNYRLFDYIEPLRGDEVPTILDVDLDGDDDVLYLVKGRLYFKENRGQEPARSYVGSVPPLILTASDNKFYNGSVYYESINGFAEANVSDGAINVEFQKPTDTSVKSFQMRYHTIVDKYRDESRDFIPETTETHLVDALADIKKDIIISSGT